MYLRRDDTVKVISGAFKGKTGKILKILEDENKVLVQGVNVRFKHVRRSQKYPQGGRIEKEQPIPASKVALIDPKTNKPTRVGFRLENGKKVRYAKRSGEPV